MAAKMFFRNKLLSNSAPRYGFTIVELLIVIVVISILVTITIVLYNGISQRASNASLQSDMVNSANLLGIDNVNNGTYPSSSGTANGGNGLKPSNGNTFSYNVSADGLTYCLQASSVTQAYFVTNSNTVPQTGTCSGNIGIAGTGLIASITIPNVTTIAGNNTYGFADGPTTTANISGPYGVAIDSSGNVYIADTTNRRIRLLNTSAYLSTFAGTSTGGFTNGTGTSAKFSSPIRIAIDSSSNLFVVDNGNNAIRKITSAAAVTTFAGISTGIAGFTNGAASSAQFNNPKGLTIDSLGNVYVADASNNVIRKITSAGTVSTYAGSSSGTAGFIDGNSITTAQFNYPKDIAIDSSNNLYIADANNNVIRKISSSGLVSTFAGSLSGLAGFMNGTGTATQFSYPSGIGIDSSGNLFVADSNNNAIRKITPAGTVSTYAGTGVMGYNDGSATGAQFSGPTDVKLDASGYVYVADIGNNRIRLIK
jgi:serine/threonine-protein kinase